MKILIFFLLVLHLSYANSQDISILFIGNSLTSINNTSKYLGILLNKSNLSINIQDISKDGYHLADHLTDTSSISKLRNCKWDYIILQDMSSSYLKPIYKNHVYKNCLFVFDSIAKINNSKVIIYSPYPIQEFPKQYCDLLEKHYMCSNTFYNEKEALDSILSFNYQLRKEYPQIKIAPIGNIIFENYSIKKRNSLWIDNLMHPSEQGAKLNALVYYFIIRFDKSKLNDKTFINNKKTVKILCKYSSLFR